MYNYFVRQFSSNFDAKLRKVGLELEIPIVQNQGGAVSHLLIQKMYAYLERQGFELKREGSCITEASKQMVGTEQEFNKTTITTDLGYSTLEIILPPFENLFEIQEHFREVMQLLLQFFTPYDCRMLGYGIQPLSAPSRHLLCPKQRYFGLEKIWTSQQIVPSTDGCDAHVLTVSAGNQCHIDVSESEAMRAANVLNGVSGLQIALQANSPIWKGKVGNVKATREHFYDYLFGEACQRHGVAPQFHHLADYVQHLLKGELFAVTRGKDFLQIGKQSFAHYLSQKQGIEAIRLNGERVHIIPQMQDIHAHNSLYYFNARLVPMYGTIEVRMACQQPPNETMVTAALNLGLVENLEEAEALLLQYDWESWQRLRKTAIREGFQAHIKKHRIVSLVRDLLLIAEKGLAKRNLGEEVLLAPLFERLQMEESPADRAIRVYEQKGGQAFLDSLTFGKVAKTKTKRLYSVPKQALVQA